MEANKIRETFLNFFRSKQHAIVPSAPMVIKNDPTLMFTNAGMNQFKDVFLGNSTAVSPRVADTQKCLRVSGKHNDLDEVGHDTYHHTMFEMLGNWSFGDYFKKEAIEWAWELLVDVMKLPKDRIYATVYEGDPKDGVAQDSEAYDLWRQFLPEDHIILGNKKDNFWEMGEAGPCGPCSEVHFDLRTDDKRKEVDGRTLVNASDPHVIEIWNLVFMQFNRKANGELEPLPARHVDTGMGFERLCMVMQGKQSNYDTDVFQPLIGKIAQMSGREYGKDEKCDIAMRVIADHLRAIAFSIADGQLPSNVKAGYVIRRILRRAVRYGYTYLGFNESFICKLVPTLVGQMGEQFGELKAQQSLIENVIQEEENSFLKTLATGITLLDSVIAKAKKAGQDEVSGSEAFTLYDTYGFPIDLTELIAREQNMGVNLKEFEAELEKQKSRSRNAATVEAEDWVELMPIRESRFVGYDELETEVRIARYRKVQTKDKVFYQIVLDKTPFYGNSGGQTGDRGWLKNSAETVAITDTLKENSLTVHIASKLPTDPKATFNAVVDRDLRQKVACNHTATHLLHEALREVLGTHVEQKGSLVTAESLRFDLSHFQKINDEELRQVETLVNSKIRANYPLDERRDCSIEQAKEMGAMMLFGEKYGDSVRVVKFGSATELCGGTHIGATGEIGYFMVLSESAISAGVRRIEAVTGVAAEKRVHLLQDSIRELQQFVNTPSVIQAIKKTFEENEELKTMVEEFKKEKIAQLVDKLSSEMKEEEGVALYSARVDMPADMVKDVAYALRQKKANLALVVGSLYDGKPMLTIMLGDEMVARGVNAGEIVRLAAKEIGGGGGGQPFFATAGGKNPQGIDSAILVAREAIKSKL